MSKIALSGDASGTGTFTIASPNSNSNFTLTLPTNSGTVLTSASNSNFPTGSVLQVVQAQTNASITTTNTSPTASGFVASITPKSSSSKVLVMVNGGNYFNDTDGREVWTFMYRQIAGGGYSALLSGNILDISAAFGAVLRATHSICVLDSPGTTSQVDYQPYFRSNTGGTSYFNAATPYVTMTLMEIAG
jgi:hypothetical protein